MPAERQRSGEVLDTRIVKALAHPTRVRILGVLRDRELASPVELAAELGLALGTVGYHVRRLEALGFIELARRTQRRGAVEHHYRARATLDLPIEPQHGRKRRAGARVGRGAEAARCVEEAGVALGGGGFDDVAALAERRRVTLDARGAARLNAALERWRAALEPIERASQRRLEAAGAAAVSYTCTCVVMLFDAPRDADAVR